MKVKSCQLRFVENNCTVTEEQYPAFFLLLKSAMLTALRDRGVIDDDCLCRGEAVLRAEQMQ